jgi:hypothetical protein
MAIAKNTIEQLVMSDVIFSKSLLEQKQKTSVDYLGILGPYDTQPEPIRRYLLSIAPPNTFDYNWRNRQRDNSRSKGSDVIKQLSKVANFKKDPDTKELYISEQIELKDKDYTVVSTGRGKNKTVFPVPVPEEEEVYPSPYHNQEILFFMATNKTIKNKAIVATDILGVKETTKRGRKKKVDYSTNDVIINKKDKADFLGDIEIEVQPTVAKTNTKTAIKKSSFMNDFIDEESNK